MTNGLYESKRATTITHVREDNPPDKSYMVKRGSDLIDLYVEARANNAFCWIG